MADIDHLRQILKVQELTSDQLNELTAHRQDVESCLRDKYGYSPVIVVGGSVEKGTLIAEAYDLDLHFDFADDDTQAGDTLEDIYNDVADTLKGGKYAPSKKRSALRIQLRDEQGHFIDLHVDVVPGRFIGGRSRDVYLHQNKGDKARLKTNILVQVDHVKNSGVIDAIRLVKLWRERNLLATKTFALELLVIEILKEQKGKALDEQFVAVLTAFRDDLATIAIQDPSNPYGNNLSAIYTDEVKTDLADAAGATLKKIDANGIQGLFGEVSAQKTIADRSARLSAVTASASRDYKPWYGNS